MANGIDPRKSQEEDERLAVTVAEVVEGYLDDFLHRAESGAKRGKRGGYDTARRLLERHALPALGKLPLREVSSEHVRRLRVQPLAGRRPRTPGRRRSARDGGLDLGIVASRPPKG